MARASIKRVKILSELPRNKTGFIENPFFLTIIVSVGRDASNRKRKSTVHIISTEKEIITPKCERVVMQYEM